MSRSQHKNAKYTFAFGVDHTPMGCFFQLWEHAARGEDTEQDDYDVPQVEADEMMGLAVHNLKTLERNPELQRLLQTYSSFEPRFVRSAATVAHIAKACGFDVTKEVYQLWD